MLSQPSFSQPSPDEGRPSPLSIDISRPDADTVVMTATGEVDFCTMSGLRQALHDAIGAGRPHVIVDLDQLNFMDASILGLLVEARERISAAGGALQVRCHTRHGRRLLSTTGLDGMLDHIA